MSNSNSKVSPAPTVSSEPFEAPLSEDPSSSQPSTQVTLQTQDKAQETPKDNLQTSDKPIGNFEKYLQDFKSNDQEKQQSGLIGIDETLTQSIYGILPRFIL